MRIGVNLEVIYKLNKTSREAYEVDDYLKAHRKCPSCGVDARINPFATRKTDYKLFKTIVTITHSFECDNCRAEWSLSFKG